MVVERRYRAARWMSDHRRNVVHHRPLRSRRRTRRPAGDEHPGV